MKSITKEQEEFLDSCTYGTWELNSKTGLVDVDGNFNCSDMGLSDFLGIEFGIIKGKFNCSHNRLVSLEGIPQEVGMSFDCSSNQLVSLVGAPQEVSGNFYCYNNNLVSLEGALENKICDFYCDPISLRGYPINLLDRIWFYSGIRPIRLKDRIKEISEGLVPDIYFKKMI